MRYIPRLLLFAAILTFSSCLNEHSKGSLDEDQVFTSAKDVYVNAVATLIILVVMPIVRACKALIGAFMITTP